MQKKQNEQAKIVCEFEFDIESVAEMEQMIHMNIINAPSVRELMYTHVSNFYSAGSRSKANAPVVASNMLKNSTH